MIHWKCEDFSLFLLLWFLFSFCFSLLAFGEGCAEPDELNPKPLELLQVHENWVNSQLLAREDGLERDDGDLPGLGLPPVLLSPHRSEFPLRSCWKRGRFVFVWNSQVLWVSFLGYFLCPAHFLLFPCGLVSPWPLWQSLSPTCKQLWGP